MERKISASLIEWKNKAGRRPLIVYGARQVGKTYSLLSFAKSAYRDYVYFNFEENRQLADIFEPDLIPERIISELSIVAGKRILPEDTLILFDEIQACERALTSLKYFSESAPFYSLIAAGSLLGVAINRQLSSYPVGKVETLTMYPLDFEEFLWANGQKELSTKIREHFANLAPFSQHEMALTLYRNYLFVGGMPRPVLEHLENRENDFVVSEQINLNNAYLADSAKYTRPAESVKIIAAFNSIPAQLAKENHKFQYKMIKSGARASEYELALDWLFTAGICYRCTKVTEGHLPLSAYQEPSAFKVYMQDTGLLAAKAGIPPALLLNRSSDLDGFKGALAENYVCGSLVTAGHEPFYWESNGKAEVDFVIQMKNGEIVPIEVKSADNVHSRSLSVFIERYRIPYAIRISTRNFGTSEHLRSLPLYAAFCI